MTWKFHVIFVITFDRRDILNRSPKSCDWSRELRKRGCPWFYTPPKHHFHGRIRIIPWPNQFLLIGTPPSVFTHACKVFWLWICKWTFHLIFFPVKVLRGVKIVISAAHRWKDDSLKFIACLSDGEIPNFYEANFFLSSCRRREVVFTPRSQCSSTREVFGRIR